MLIRENLNAAKLAIPVVLDARLTVERGIVLRQYRGEPIGSISDLATTGARTLRDLMLDGAKTLISYNSKFGYEPLTPPESFIVWGPYQHRPVTLGRKPLGSDGWAEGDDVHPDKCDFVIKGQFLATRGKVPELTL